MTRNLAFLFLIPEESVLLLFSLQWSTQIFVWVGVWPYGLKPRVYLSSNSSVTASQSDIFPWLVPYRYIRLRPFGALQLSSFFFFHYPPFLPEIKWMRTFTSEPFHTLHSKNDCSCHRHGIMIPTAIVRILDWFSSYEWERSRRICSDSYRFGLPCPVFRHEGKKTSRFSEYLEVQIDLSLGRR